MYSIVELMDLAENPTMVYFTITKSKPNICINPYTHEMNPINTIVFRTSCKL